MSRKQAYVLGEWRETSESFKDINNKKWTLEQIKEKSVLIKRITWLRRKRIFKELEVPVREYKEKENLNW